MRETLRSLSNKKKKLKYVKQKFDIVNYNIRILLLYVKCSHTRINSCCAKFFLGRFLFKKTCKRIHSVYLFWLLQIYDLYFTLTNISPCLLGWFRIISGLSCYDQNFTRLSFTKGRRNLALSSISPFSVIDMAHHSIINS